MFDDIIANQENWSLKHLWRHRSAKGGLIQFREDFTVIPCAPKDLKREWPWYLKAFGSQIKSESFLKVK